MAEIIEINPGIAEHQRSYYFSVYELPVIDEANNFSHKRYIVLKNCYGVIVCFTALEQYAGKYTGKKRIIRTRSKPELEYICRALNSILIDREPFNTAQSVSRINGRL